jgi:hypothetical protein
VTHPTLKLALCLPLVCLPACEGDGGESGDGLTAESGTGDGDSGDGDSGDGDSGDGDSGDGDSGDGDTGDGDGDSTTGGDGDADGIVYIADPSGLITLDLSDGSSAQLGAELPKYNGDRLAVSPDGMHLFFETDAAPVIVDTATGTNQATDAGFFTDGVMGWIDNDSVLNSEVIRVGIRSLAGVQEAEYQPQSGGYASRWNTSPDGNSFAVTEAGTGRIKIFPTSGSVDFTDDILLTQDCRAPTWLANGTLVGVCINSQEFYYTSPGETEVVRVALDAPEYDVQGSTIWTGDDSILVHLGANGSGGAVGHRFVVIDSSGTQTGDVEWLAELPGSAGLFIRNIRISKDDSTVIWSDQGPELWRANIDGSGQEEFDPASQLVLEFDWSAGK